MLNEPDLRLPRAAIALSACALERGNAPYGAVLADEHGDDGR